jgi:hypothetical protein
MAETFEAYRNRVLSYLGDEDPIAVQQATPIQLERRLRNLAPEELGTLLSSVLGPLTLISDEVQFIYVPICRPLTQEPYCENSHQSLGYLPNVRPTPKPIG